MDLHQFPSIQMFSEFKSTWVGNISWSSLVPFAGGLIASYFLVLLPFYNVLLHPLRKYPGPKIFAASPLPWGFGFMSGKWHHKLMELHDKYGPIVRIGPNELSYSCPEAWEDVYGRYIPGKRKENPKPEWYCSPKAHDIVGATLGNHGRMRRVLAPGFTYGAMVKQEPMIKEHVDLLLQRFREKADNGKAAINILEWFAYCTFDVVGDLSFGEPFGCLRESMMHPWIKLLFANVYLTHILMICKRLPLFYVFLPLKATFQLFKDFQTLTKVLREVIAKRLALGIVRNDLVDIMTSKKGSLYLTNEEIFKNAMLITAGGSETTSNSLTALAYIIATTPHVKAKILEELHTTFASEDEINMRSVSNLHYLHAVIEEVLRFYPPGPNAMWRITPPEGNTILGDWIPGNTVLGVPHRVVYRSEHYFKRANEFLPERWLSGKENSEFANDRRDGFHPFSYGPRSCIAMNLAYAEMRYIGARFMWNFDVEIAEQSRNWMDNQLAYLIWEKPGLYVHLKPRNQPEIPSQN